jgi:hypothetical protein
MQFLEIGKNNEVRIKIHFTKIQSNYHSNIATVSLGLNLSKSHLII